MRNASSQLCPHLELALCVFFSFPFHLYNALCVLLIFVFPYPLTHTKTGPSMWKWLCSFVIHTHTHTHLHAIRSGFILQTILYIKHTDWWWLTCLFVFFVGYRIAKRWRPGFSDNTSRAVTASSPPINLPFDDELTGRCRRRDVASSDQMLTPPKKYICALFACYVFIVCLACVDHPHWSCWRMLKKKHFPLCPS